jgi:hypothetical protein
MRLAREETGGGGGGRADIGSGPGSGGAGALRRLLDRRATWLVQTKEITEG